MFLKFKMSNYERWRVNAKRAAWADLIFTVAGFLILVLFLLNLLTHWIDYADLTTHEAFLRCQWVLWIALGLAILSKIFQLIAAIGLIKATDVGRHPLEAWTLIKFWFLVTIYILIVDTIAIAISLKRYASIFKMIPTMFIFVVSKFAKELRLQSRLCPTSEDDIQARMVIA